MSWPSILLAAGLLLAAAAPPPGDEEVRRLVRQLGAEEYAEREAAMRRLREFGEKARQQLEAAAGSEDAEVRERAAALLMEINWRLPADLAARVGDFAREFAAYTTVGEEDRLRLLGELRSRAPVEAERYVLQAFKEQTSPRARAWLADMLGAYRSPAAAESLLVVSRQEDRFCRSSAAAALARSEGAEAQRRLLELADDVEPSVRRAALLAIAERGRLGRNAGPAVAKHLEDADETVRAAAARCTGRIGHREGLEGLWKLAAEEEVSVRIEAIQAIGVLAARDEAPVAARLAKLLGDRMPAVRATALAALQTMRARSALPSLIPLMTDEDSEIAAGAIRAVGDLAGAEQAPALRKLLKNEDATVSGAAALALARIGDREALPAIAALLTGSSAPGASLAARALGSTGDVKWAEELDKAAKRWSAESFTALCLEIRAVRLRDRRALSPLIQMTRAAEGDEPLSLAQLLSMHALFAESAELLAKAVRTHMDEPSLVSAWGIGMIQAGHGAEGMKLLQLAHSMDPLDAVVANNLAWFLLTAPEPAVRNPTKALRVAERAVALSPRAGYIVDTYAWALFRSGRSKEALEAMDRAIDLTRASEDGDMALLRGHRARVLNALGRREDALKEMAEALAGSPREPELALEAARMYCEMGMPQRAVGELERMVNLGYPDLPNLRHDPELVRARAEPAFPKLLQRAGEVVRELRVETVRPVPEPVPEVAPDAEAE